LLICKDMLDAQALAVIGMQFFREPNAHKRCDAPSECVDADLKWKRNFFNFRFTVDLAKRKIIRAQCFLNALDQGHHILANRTGEEVNGAVIIFGPGMQTCMRLCEKQKTGKAMRAKLVKALIHNRQAAFVYGSRK
jgi:hypothetical protein